ncbi:uncharacterized protein I303_104371 [Kwoniella dejecticola CBS 10117]|uniref:Kinesin motor domain-containing protein n=1 Tax=Kwoniella dejecticola CBS 10117 TaxID=1296121 RepID=A0A1A6A5I2_9TREE|nr:uncharacterized protein I303_04653 [Kwoniella dejecticola CBS 10117]OBR85318.1 hypothetical protein I303_04653 [Kwoniella dejecticola CBS 10117]
MGSKRASAILSPPMSPSPSALQRPSSSMSSVRQRVSSDASTVMGDASESRNVRVVLRIRPSDPNDPSVPPRFRTVLVHPTSPSEVRLDVDPATLAGQTVGSSHAAGKKHPLFNFDHVLGEQATQTELYDVTARETVDEFIKGHNVTFLAYGQTSSGKSYSMGTTGEEVDYSGTEFTPRTGLIPRTVHSIFEKAEEIRQQSGAGASWECRLSFLELYNEEIIDLLSGSGVAIQIREERDGRIVWAGIKEVKVKSLEEVMYLLQAGSERRKTGETSMNATSSRSHAIFSLTLVQKKRSGAISSPSGIPRSETPTRQLRRPSSTIGLPGPRSPTPSSVRGGPPSSYGRATPTGRPMSMQPPPSPNTNEFVITTSKFNMVDLAGSERLKRTAAQGDRMREGISINSGLLALGNVISTLCDPVKARGHIPYRDSKLTRMLQDSIGGNSLTTMIACISPIEANIGETINTIKYASRARSIRNQAKINQVEAGWDDVEHLQSTVMKLRKQLSMLMEDGKGSTNGHSPAASEESIKQSEKLIQRLAELQREHTELYDRYLQKCSENMRLSGELRTRDPVDNDASSKFNEMVEPVILEYEKVVSALNQQLDELRGELSAMSEMQEDQNRQLQEARDRQSQSESYVSELRSRLAKLTERNSSSEAYIQDLEAKLKTHAEKEDSHSDAIAELKKDIARLRENNATLNQHTFELEARLSRSESTATGLAAQVEKQEKEAERREAAYRDLEAHIALLDTSKDNKLLLEELDQRDQKIAELEKDLEEKAASEEKERSRLVEAVQAEKSIQSELRSRLSSMQASAAAASLPTPASPPSENGIIRSDVTANTRSPLPTHNQLTPPDSPQGSQSRERSDDADEVEELKKALRDLAEKFSNSESRVAELTTQLSEARLVNAEMEDTVPPSPSPATEDEEETLSEAETTLQTPRDSMSATSPSRRRGSMPILSATKSPGQSPGFRGGRGYGDSARMRPQSLSQELSSAQSLGTSPRASWTPIQSHSRNNSLLLSSPSPTNSMHTLKPSRSSQSLEAELKFVHRIVEERDEELKDREAYIRQLEDNLQKQHIIPSLIPSATANKTTSNSSDIAIPATPKTPRISVDIPNTPPRNIPLPDSPRTPSANVAELPSDKQERETEHEDQNGELHVPAQSEVEMGGLSPKSVKRFSQLKDTLHLLENGGSESNEAQDKIDGLMKEMVDKEESQKKIIEQQFIQIADLQKMNNKLKEELNEREVFPQTAEVEELRRERDQLISEKAQSFPLVPSTPSGDVVVMDRLKAEHAEDLRSLIQGHKDTVTVLQSEHLQALNKLKSTIESNETSHRAEIEELQAKHDTIINDLQSRHSETLEAIQEENDMIAEEMEKSLSQSEEERRQLKMRADQALFELSRIRDEHALQRNNDAKSISELTRSREQSKNDIAELEKVNDDLQSQNNGLKQQVVELEGKLKDSRKSVNIPPPQGPPPTTPLPPLPKKRSVANMKLDLSSPTSANGFNRENGPSSADYFGRSAESNSNHSHMSDAKEQISKLLSEKDIISGEKEELLGEKEDLKKEMKDIKRKVQDVENKLMEEKVKVTNLTFDLRESQKQNTKLRSHLEESKREVKQLTDTCNLHITELNARREEANRFSEEGHKNRDSLQAAQAQVETLKRQLDKAVEKKVNKKLLGCF